MKTCTIDGCLGLCNISKINGKILLGGYCTKHYQKLRKYGDPLFRINSDYGKGTYKNLVYRAYYSMKYRVNSMKSKDYKYYGGRGIKICDRWLGIDGFSNFCNDMGDRPEGMTLDRIDNNGNYCPGNCKRSNKNEQQSNRRNNNKIVGVAKNGKNGWFSQLQVKGVLYRKVFKKYEDAVCYRKNLEKIYNI